MKQVRDSKGEAESAEPGAYDFGESYTIRAKMLGVLLRDARENAARTVEDCAQLLTVSPETVLAWEYGDIVPGLPQLEILAYYLDVPVSHFWSSTTLEAESGKHLKTQNEFIALRERMVGGLLRQAREELGFSHEQVSEMTSIAAENLHRYELGELSVPMHELSVLAGSLNKTIDFFMDSSSYIGDLLASREEWKHFTNLREDLRQFAANPLNIGFIEIALMLSQMPAERLRKVGESIIDITM
jgi:transcriptional regulator with XRE-family HTH domain